MSDTEKVTINIGVVDLGQIDLLVQQGFYSNRTDFMRTACRNLLSRHADEVKQAVSRRQFVLGVTGYNRHDLEAALSRNEQLEIKVVGMLVIHKDVPVDLAVRVIRRIELYGMFRATKEIKDALKDRINTGSDS